MDEQRSQTEVSASNAGAQPPHPLAATVDRPPKRSKKKVVIVLIVVTVALLLLGGGAWAYYQAMNNKPEKVLADALVNTANASLTGSPTLNEGSLVVNLGEGNQVTQATINFTTKSVDKNGQVEADLALKIGALTLNLSGSVIALSDGTYYIKIDNLREVLNLTTLSGDESLKTTLVVLTPLINKLDGAWVEITPEALGQVGATPPASACQTALNNLQINQQDSQQLKTIFKNNQFVTVAETFPNEKVAGRDSFHYKLQFNAAAAEQFSQQALALPSLSGLEECGDVSGSSRALLEPDAKGNQPAVELWVDKKTHNPTKLKVTYQQEALSLELDSTIDLAASGVKVEAPEQSISLSELQQEIESIMTTFLLGAGTASQ